MARTKTVTVDSHASSKLGHYVYAYRDPRSGRVFYIGKGSGRRALSHLTFAPNSRVSAIIRSIRKSGSEPRIEVLAHGLPNADVALRLESALIRALGVETLANKVRGQGARYDGKSIEDLVAYYTRRHANIRDEVMLIRIKQLYRDNLSEMELYDVTRGWWKLSKRREGAKFALAVYGGVVKEVYSITHWLPARSTLSSRWTQGSPYKRKWEFVGLIAPEGIRKRYLNKYVGHYFTPGARNSIQYENC